MKGLVYRLQRAASRVRESTGDMHAVILKLLGDTVEVTVKKNPFSNPVRFLVLRFPETEEEEQEAKMNMDAALNCMEGLVSETMEKP